MVFCFFFFFFSNRDVTQGGGIAHSVVMVGSQEEVGHTQNVPASSNGTAGREEGWAEHHGITEWFGLVWKGPEGHQVQPPAMSRNIFSISPLPTPNSQDVPKLSSTTSTPIQDVLWAGELLQEELSCTQVRPARAGCPDIASPPSLPTPGHSLDP